MKQAVKERIYLSSPHLGEEEQLFVQAAFTSNWIAPLGPNVDAFEEELAAYVGSGHAAAVSSGTAAIHLALELLGVTKGDVVFCSSLTFVASANPILYQGAEPVFIDSEPDSWNMSPVALEEALIEAKRENKLPKALVVVNLYGQSADYSRIRPLCQQYGIPIVEDAAESLGSTYQGNQTGTFGQFGVFSFNGNKIITTSGGGMLVSDNKEAIQRAKFLATQAREPEIYYQHQTLGYNYRLSNILAGIGRGQLRVLDDRVQARRNVFQRYEEELRSWAGIVFMPELQESYSNRWLTALTLDKAELGVTRLDLIHALGLENIEARPVWKPLHLQPLFTGCRYYRHEGRSVSEELFRDGLCLPSGSNLTSEQQERVLEVFKETVSNAPSAKGIAQERVSL
ncbi:DegT/DnrJ/EryC1/StrS family aminotransferase [Bacillus horti]|uniref:Pyridoxal phosphate-dependent aminotransferase EpsN n=1 Tax=Caldalkalibacillus horti TaxID=77523 RepID=A0ABT9VZF0_9BACI|nr:aminotransferase class I/II-fold pyridoxal phosphate-dependent enzyme [Bacillus horti]MDQ0166372.1 pyridoxal phosphate-dependent aminotransferase EpsN [Bacillus horti]